MSTILNEMVEVKILEESIEWLNALYEEGILSEDDLEAIIENDDLTIVDLANFLEEMNDDEDDDNEDENDDEE